MRSTSSFVMTASAAVAFAATAATATDQPIAGQATLVGKKLPPWGRMLPRLTEGFSGLYPVRRSHVAPARGTHLGRDRASLGSPRRRSREVRQDFGES